MRKKSLATHSVMVSIALVWACLLSSASSLWTALPTGHAASPKPHDDLAPRRKSILIRVRESDRAATITAQTMRRWLSASYDVKLVSDNLDLSLANLEKFDALVLILPNDTLYQSVVNKYVRDGHGFLLVGEQYRYMELDKDVNRATHAYASLFDFTLGDQSGLPPCNQPGRLIQSFVGISVGSSVQLAGINSVASPAKGLSIVQATSSKQTVLAGAYVQGGGRVAVSGDSSIWDSVICQHNNQTFTNSFFRWLTAEPSKISYRGDLKLSEEPTPDTLLQQVCVVDEDGWPMVGVPLTYRVKSLPSQNEIVAKSEIRMDDTGCGNIRVSLGDLELKRAFTDDTIEMTAQVTNHVGTVISERKTSLSTFCSGYPTSSRPLGVADSSCLPYIVYIKIGYAGNGVAREAACSGTLIEQDFRVVTAAHCLKFKDAVLTSLEVIPGTVLVNGRLARPFGTCSVKLDASNIRFPEQFEAISVQDHASPPNHRAFDYGVIKGCDFTQQGLKKKDAYQLSVQEQPNGSTASSYGYPGETPGASDQQFAYEMIILQARVDLGSLGVYDFYGAALPTEAGQSGGPLIAGTMNNGSGKSLIGILTAGVDTLTIFVKITQEKKTFLETA